MSKAMDHLAMLMAFGASVGGVYGSQSRRMFSGGTDPKKYGQSLRAKNRNRKRNKNKN